jgi:hypothetical protein
MESKSIIKDLPFYIFVATIGVGFVAGMFYLLYSWLF